MPLAVIESSPFLHLSRTLVQLLPFGLGLNINSNLFNLMRENTIEKKGLNHNFLFKPMKQTSGYFPSRLTSTPPPACLNFFNKKISLIIVGAL